MLGLDSLPLGRVVNDEKVQDHHAIIPTRSEHDLGRMGQDELKVYDLVTKRFLAIFHPRPSTSARAWRRRSASTCSARAGAG